MEKRILALVTIIVVVVVVAAGVVYFVSLPKKNTSAPITFTIGVTQGTKTLDPAIAYDFTSNAAVHNLYDDLFQPVKTNGKLSVAPNIVSNYTVSSNGLNYTMTINSGILFHDNSTMTAYDVAFSFNRMLALNQGISYVWNGVLTAGNVTAINNSTFTIHLIHPYAPFIATLVMVYVVEKKLVVEHEATGNFSSNGDYGVAWLSTHDAGSGPYMLKSYDPATQVTFQKFTNYWKGWTTGQPDLAMMQVEPEEAAVKTAITSHTIDMTDYTLLIQTYQNLSKVQGITVQNDSAFNLLMVMMNCMKAPTNNTYVRQAISYAFQYDEALQQILPGDQQAQGPVVNTMPGHNDSVLTYSYNLAKAKQLMNESGFTPAQLASMDMKIIYVNSLEWEAQVAALVQTDLAPLGINVTLNPLPWLQMVSLSANYTTEPNFFILSSTAGYMDASYYLVRYEMTATGYTSAFFYKNQTLSNQIESSLTTLNDSQRLKMYENIQQEIATAAPCVWIANDEHRIAFWDNVQGYTFYGLLGFDIYFYNFHITSSSSSTSSSVVYAPMVSTSTVIPLFRGLLW